VELFWWLSIAYFLTASIHTFDKRLNQQKKQHGQDFGSLPPWIVIFSFAMYGIQVAMLYVDWKKALIAFAVGFALALLPVLDIVGNLLCTPLNWFSKTRNTEL
jgi:uncharacterized membrane protein YjjP (DUF1212 family)